MTRQEILEQAKALDPRDREELIEDLRQLSDSDGLTDEQWAELDRRIEAAERGQGDMIPGETVLSDLRKRFGL